jgi:hypothetical protein
MSRYRLLPSPAQEAVLQVHCAHARYVWNPAVEQHAHWHPGRKGAPGELLLVPSLTGRERARLRARETDRRKDWAEKASTAIARRFDLIRVEALQIPGMIRSAKATVAHPGRNVRAKAGLNRGILRSGWGLLVHRLADKAPGRVEKVNPAFTSQRCAANADVNAAINIAAGHAVNARGGRRDAGPVNREPQLLASFTGCQ